jgi:hypothetical protein
MSFYCRPKTYLHNILLVLCIILYVQCRQHSQVKSGSLQTDSTSQYAIVDSIMDPDSIVQDTVFESDSDYDELESEHALSAEELSVLNRLSNKSKFTKDDINYLVEHFGYYHEMDRPDSMILNKKIRIIGDSTKVHIWRIESQSKDPDMDQMFIFHPDCQKLFFFWGLAEVEFFKISKKADPYLLIYTSTKRGNGSCALVRWNGSSFSDVLYNTFLSEYPRTYDAHQDDDYIIGNKLNPIVKDINKDGHLDIILQGRIFTNVYQFYHPERYSKYKDTSFFEDEWEVFGKIIPVLIKYIYEPESGIFRCNQDLDKEYINPYKESK